MGRLPLPADQRKYNIEAIQDQHREIMRRIVLGQKGVDIANELGVSEAMVVYVRNSSLGRAEIDRLQEQANDGACDVRQRINNALPKALDFLEKVLGNEGSDEAIRVKVAMDLLSRAGHVAPTRFEGELTHNHLTMEDIESIKERAKKSPNVIDVVAQTAGSA